MSDMMGVSEDTAERIRSGLLDWADYNLRDFPWRETSDPYKILVSEVLLQKTLAAKVPAVYEEFLYRYPDPSTLTDADVDEIADLLEPFGLQNQRAKALVDIGDDFAAGGAPTIRRNSANRDTSDRTRRMSCFASHSTITVSSSTASAWRRSFIRSILDSWP